MECNDGAIGWHWRINVRIKLKCGDTTIDGYLEKVHATILKLTSASLWSPGQDSIRVNEVYVHESKVDFYFISDSKETCGVTTVNLID
jgi:hypothetical protein